MEDDLQQHIADAAEQHASNAWRRMPSAAGHDPMVIVKRVPCAMLFVPSIGGISGDFAEDSNEEDIILGCQVLATATAAICESLSWLGDNPHPVSYTHLTLPTTPYV